jgi:large subunit ribosomal protein L13
MEKKVYYSHTFYPGGLKSATLKEKMEDNSDFVIKHSIRGMLPVNKLRDGRLARLKIYKGEAHNHDAQKPEIYKIGKSK